MEQDQNKDRDAFSDSFCAFLSIFIYCAILTSSNKTAKLRYYWAEEQPLADDPPHTLNGFIYGVFGLYEYC